MRKPENNTDITYREHEDEIILEGLKQYGNRASQYSKSKGLPITKLQGNHIIKIHSNSKSVICEIPQSKFRITQRSFNLEIK